MPMFVFLHAIHKLRLKQLVLSVLGREKRKPLMKLPLLNIFLNVSTCRYGMVAENNAGLYKLIHNMLQAMIKREKEKLIST